MPAVLRPTSSALADPRLPGEASWQAIDAIIEAYHALTADPTQVSQASIDGLQQGLAHRKASFGGRLLCPYLRPNFLARSHFDYVAGSIQAVMGAIRKIETRALADDAFFDRMGLTPEERALMAIEPRLARFSYKSRMDTFLSREGLHFVEYNAESPAGIGYGDALQQAFLEFGPTLTLGEQHTFGACFSMQHVLHTLLACYREWGGSGSPTIAIVDYGHVPTYTEFEMFRDFFVAAGHTTVIVDPRELELRGGRLWGAGVPVDVVYRRVLVNELIEKLDQCQALVEAVRQGVVCMVNPFRAKLLHKKLLFAMLWSDDIQGGLTASELAAVRQHVPWTARVEPGTVQSEGRTLDLLDWIVAHRDQLVLKPNDEYGGKGVVLGWEVDAQAWEEALQAALEHPSVVQQRVPVARLDFPDVERNLGARTVDLDPFIFGDRVTGFLTRLSDTSLCNVTSGGGQVPTYVVEGV